MPRSSENEESLDATEPVLTRVQASSQDDETLRIRRVRERRRRYLDAHPKQVQGNELLDPILYDRLIRRFQSPTERQAAAREKNSLDAIEARLIRAEMLQEASDSARAANGLDTRISGMRLDGDAQYDVLRDYGLEVPESRGEGEEIWLREMSERFIQGKDRDFDYKLVDDSEEWDDWQEEARQEEERYYNEETPEWFVENGKGASLQGETGVQDF